MTHMRQMDESEGKLSQPTPSERKCRTCGEAMEHQSWSSHCGSYEDSKYTCPRGHVEWVDGIDS